LRAPKAAAAAPGRQGSAAVDAEGANSDLADAVGAAAGDDASVVLALEKFAAAQAAEAT